jgi:hypothetical protein
MAMLELLPGMGFGEDLTVHGFRSTFKDWCSEQTVYPNEMSEMALRMRFRTRLRLRIAAATCGRNGAG